MADDEARGDSPDVDVPTGNFADLRNSHRRLEGDVRQARDDAAEARAALDEAKDENRRLTLEAAGIDPDDPHGEAVLALHGDSELTAEALQQTAETFGLTADDPARPGETLSAEQTQVLASAERARMMEGIGVSVGPPTTLDGRIAEAEREGARTGDWSRFDRLQAQFLMRGDQ